MFNFFPSFPGDSGRKESACSVEDLGSVPGLVRSLPTPVFLPGESHGHKNLVSCSPWGHKESNMSEQHGFKLAVCFPGGTSGKEPTCQYRRREKLGFGPWVGKIPWRRAWQPVPVFLPGDAMDREAWQATLHSVAKSWKCLKRLHAYPVVIGLAVHGFTLLVRPAQHFILFVAIISGIVFWITFSVCSSLAYRNASCFCVLVLISCKFAKFI